MVQNTLACPVPGASGVHPVFPRMLAQTLIVFQALSAALFGLALLLTSLVRRGTRMCAVAGAALLLIGIGNAGLALRDRIADELSIVLAGTLFPLALVLFHFAVSRFVHPGRRALDPVGWVLVVLLGLWQWIFTEMQPDLAMRALGLLGCAGVQTARIAWMMTEHARSLRGSDASRWLAGSLGMMAALLLGAAALFALGFGPSAHAFEPSPVSSILLVLRVLLLAGISFLVARVDLEEAAEPVLSLADREALRQRHEAEDAARRMLSRARASRKPLAVAVVIFDGHETALRRIGPERARHLVEQVRELCAPYLRHEDLTLNVSPDAFAVFMPGLAAAPAESLVQGLRTFAARRAGALPDVAGSTTLSIGLTQLGPGRGSLGELIAAAREIAQRVHASGGDGVALDPGLRDTPAD